MILFLLYMKVVKKALADVWVRGKMLKKLEKIGKGIYICSFM